jgi:hypothetical protein
MAALRKARPTSIEPVIDHDESRSPRNGLTAEEEKVLRRRANQAEMALSRPGCLGGNEVKALERLRAELLRRLDPISVEGLEAKAAALLDPMIAQKQTFYWLSADTAPAEDEAA